MTLADAKAALRAQVLAARAKGGDDAALTARLSVVLAGYRGRSIAIYWPIRDEADPRPALADHDGPVLLPVVVGRDRPLIFRVWHGEALQPGPFGTAHPGPASPEAVPDVVIVPLVGFDGACHRLGYGGGFYDRTLSGLRAGGSQNGPGGAGVIAIGLAYGVQQVPLIPVGDFDQPLDLIVTDQAIFRR